MVRWFSSGVGFGMAALACVAALAAENWPNWRGPDHNGVARGSGFVTEWGPEKNLLWKLDLPGLGSSTPTVLGDRLYLTAADKERNWVLCVADKGEVLWQTPVGAPRAGKHKKATGCNPSITTDGQRLYAYFKSGDLACLDLEGKIIWRHNLQEAYGEDTLWWDLGTSPVLTADHVVVAVMQTGPSYLVAYEKDTGKLAWKRSRDLGAPVEAAQSYSTPVVCQQEGRALLVVVGADHVTGHDAKTGEELWRVGGLNPKQNGYFRSIASAVVTEGVVVAPYARGGSLTGIRLGGAGDVTKTHVAWHKEGLGADVPTPAASGARAYVCTDRGELACLEAATGKVLWKGELEKNRHAYSASPILADGKIFCTREDGKTFVAAQGDAFKLLSGNELGDNEFVVATPVLVNGRVYIRSQERLFCFGVK